MIPVTRSDARLWIILAALLSLACGRDEEPDAYGNFEAIDVIVSAETGGQLLEFTADEGDRLQSGSVVGQVDTVQLALQLNALEAERIGARSQTGSAGAEAGALAAQLETARIDLGRIQRLHARKAATPQQLDEAETRVRILEERLRGARHQTTGAGQQIEAIDAQIARIRDRIERSRITSPVNGTVLATFAEAGEYVQPGQPLFRVASLDTLILRAWLGEPQLARVKLGGEVTVRVDQADEERRAFTGTVSWISSEAEFTPTPVQTRDERADLVYAIKVRVPNPEGVLKIGMPADVEFSVPDSL